MEGNVERRKNSNRLSTRKGEEAATVFSVYFDAWLVSTKQQATVVGRNAWKHDKRGEREVKCDTVSREFLEGRPAMSQDVGDV